MTRACIISQGLRPGHPAAAAGCDLDHSNAIDRTRCNTQIATRAGVRQDRMHLLGGADDGIDRTSLDTQGATDARCFIDDRAGTAAFDAIDGIERQQGLAQQAGQACNSFGATRRTLIERSAAISNGFGIRSASRIAAFAALGLRQQVFDLVGEGRGGGEGHGGQACGAKQKPYYPGNGRGLLAPMRCQVLSAAIKKPLCCKWAATKACFWAEPTDFSTSGVGLDEFSDLGADQFAPAAARKNAVVAAFGGGEMLLACFRNRRA